MANLVDVFVLFSLHLTILFWWNDYLHPLFFCVINNGIAVIATIGKQILCLYSFNHI